MHAQLHCTQPVGNLQTLSSDWLSSLSRGRSGAVDWLASVPWVLRACWGWSPQDPSLIIATLPLPPSLPDWFYVTWLCHVLLTAHTVSRAGQVTWSRSRAHVTPCTWSRGSWYRPPLLIYSCCTLRLSVFSIPRAWREDYLAPQFQLTVRTVLATWSAGFHWYFQPTFWIEFWSGIGLAFFIFNYHEIIDIIVTLS